LIAALLPLWPLLQVVERPATMSGFRAPRDELRTIGSNTDSVWVKWFGYHQTAKDTIHTVDNDLKTVKFDTGFHSTNVPDKLYKHMMYRTLDNVSTPVADNSCFVLFNGEYPCKLRLLKFESEKSTLYKFSTDNNKFEACNDDIREWYMIRHWYKDTVCPLAEKDSRFTLLNSHGLTYARPFLKSFPKWMLEDPEVIAMNYVTRLHSKNVIRMNCYVKACVLFPLVFPVYRFIYFEEYKEVRNRIMKSIDPRGHHISKLPRGLVFNMAFAAVLASTIEVI
jgi:hypothetical protein